MTAIRSHRNVDCNSDARVAPVVHVVAVASVGYVDVVVVVPIIRPILRPRVQKSYPVTLVLETWVSVIDHKRESEDTEEMLRSEVSAIPIVRNSVAVITASLLP